MEEENHNIIQRTNAVFWVILWGLVLIIQMKEYHSNFKSVMVRFVFQKFPLRHKLGQGEARKKKPSWDTVNIILM